MADWEQPSTSLEFGTQGGDDLETLRRELASAVARIESLEQRVMELESEVAGLRGRALGA